MFKHINAVIKKVRCYEMFWKERQYYNTKALETANLLKKLKGQNCDTLILTIAFNNALVIEKQIEEVMKYCKSDNYVYLVMDNSSDNEKGRKIQEVCTKMKNPRVLYCPMPKFNPYSGKAPSASHGVALNWSWRNVVENVKSIKWILLIDHDIFPIKEFDVRAMLQSQIAYGLKIEIKQAWYLWPGYCAFDVEKVGSHLLNFMPGKYGDTGAMNYPKLYKNCNVNKMKFAHDRLIWINKEENSEPKKVQRDSVQVVDESWLHMLNASNWAELDNVDEKFRQVVELLEKMRKE